MTDLKKKRLQREIRIMNDLLVELDAEQTKPDHGRITDNHAKRKPDATKSA
jgi:hypothetical protein